jgi:hypothetical protein
MAATTTATARRTSPAAIGAARRLVTAPRRTGALAAAVGLPVQMAATTTATARRTSPAAIGAAHRLLTLQRGNDAQKLIVRRGAVTARWSRIVEFFAGIGTIATAIAAVLALILTLPFWGGHIIPGADNGPACSDGRDNDGDGKTDFSGRDSGCSSRMDTSERNAACSDKKDNDDDGETDLSDDSCLSANDPSEKDVACSDGRDNDHDGKIDDDDDGCASANDPAEKR